MNKVTDIFSNIYATNRWDHGSGPGSLPEATVEYQKILKEVITKNEIKTVLDYGCGDWQFSKLLNWENMVDHYIGADVVPLLIENHRLKYANSKVSFKLIDNDFSWNNVDLIICKDVLQHLSLEIIDNILKEMKVHAKYLLITNDTDGPKGSLFLNKECRIGEWRPVDVSASPWNLSGEKLLTWKVRNRTKQTLLIKNS